MADVVVGRPAYDNYLVALAIQQNVTVVDATDTLLAVHKTDQDGNVVGHHNKDKAFNAICIGKFDCNKAVADLAYGFCGLSPPLSLKVGKPSTSWVSRIPGAMLSEDFTGAGCQ